MRKIVLWGLVAVVGFLAARALPDVARYLKIRRM